LTSETAWIVIVIGAILPMLLLLVSPTLAKAQAGGGAGNEERIRPGDVIRVRIWREEDMSGEVPVDERGVAVFPKLGPITVTDRSPSELREYLLEEYHEVLRNPSIEITFLKRVTILGAVREPNLYLVDPTMTVAEALALAGGSRPEGAADRVELIRDGEKLQTLTERTVIGNSSIRSGDQLFVPERGWAARNPGVVAAVISSLVSVAITLMVR
jgi:polysaccharide export outer membrane protein